jgi:hypothetical protein
VSVRKAPIRALAGPGALSTREMALSCRWSGIEMPTERALPACFSRCSSSIQ